MKQCIMIKKNAGSNSVAKSTSSKQNPFQFLDGWLRQLFIRILFTILA